MGTAGQDYPEPKFLGPRPSYGLFARLVTGVTFSGLKLGWGHGNATVRCCSPDARPSMVLEDATGVVFTRLGTKRAVGPNDPGYDVGLRKGAQRFGHVVV